jgi:hypothetical protein
MLLWLVGASYPDLCLVFGVASSTFYNADSMLWPKIKGLEAAFLIRFPFHDLDQIESLSQDFYTRSGSILDDCVFTINGFGDSI